MSHRPRQLQARCSAFTLVELSLSMAIIVTLSAIAMPRYARAIAAYRARCAAQRVVEDFAQIQSLARTSSTSKSITFHRGSSRYVVANLKDLDTASTSYNVSLSAEPYKSAIGTVNFNGVASITFDGYGYPNCGGSLTLTSGDATKTITIDAATGKASVQ